VVDIGSAYLLLKKLDKPLATILVLFLAGAFLAERHCIGSD
jgi:hypothetical protein